MSPLGNKSNLHTKSSTENEDREPVPSFLKALSYQQSELFEEENDILDQTFSNPSLVTTEESGKRERYRIQEDNHLSSDAGMTDNDGSKLLIVESFGE